MIKINYYLGLDGGGTSSKAYLADADANIIASVNGPSANYQVIGIKKLKNSLNKTIELLLSQADLAKENNIIERASFGLAGIDTKIDYNKLMPVIAQNSYINKFSLFNDSELALIGANTSRIGMILISGTGSIALARDKNLYQKRVGGWGHLFDDEGSGYNIAINALNYIFKAYDGRGRKTFIRDLFLQQLEIKDEADLLEKVYVNKMTRSQIADLAKLVFVAANRGDYIARKIINEAAASLAELIKAIILDDKFAGDSLIKKNEYGNIIDIAIVGGVFKSDNKIFINNLKNKIKKMVKEKYIINQINLNSAVLSPAAGALFDIYKKDSSLDEKVIIKKLKLQDDLYQ